MTIKTLNLDGSLFDICKESVVQQRNEILRNVDSINDNDTGQNKNYKKVIIRSSLLNKLIKVENSGSLEQTVVKKSKRKQARKEEDNNSLEILPENLRNLKDNKVVSQKVEKNQQI
jgi:hypothetical protein